MLENGYFPGFSMQIRTRTTREAAMRYPDDAIHSRALYNRAKKSLPGGNTRTTVYHAPFPIYAARGEGCRVWDVDGVARIDCINNFTSMIHGHAHPAINEAVFRQAALGTAFGMPTEIGDCAGGDPVRSCRIRRTGPLR